MTLTVDFNVTTDPNIDQVLTQMRESQAESQLPSSVRDYGITVAKSTSAPLMVISLYSPTGQFDSKFLANYGLHQFERPDCPGARHRERYRLRSGPICAPDLG